MPFDGIGYIGPKETGGWSGLAQFAKTLFTWQAPPRVRAFCPLPSALPDEAAKQVLTIGRALIADRKDWVQRRYETRDGRRCAVGALRGAARLLNLHGQQTAANALLLAVAMDRGFNDIESMNDNSSHSQVLSAFDEAICRANGLPQTPAAWVA